MNMVVMPMDDALCDIHNATLTRSDRLGWKLLVPKSPKTARKLATPDTLQKCKFQVLRIAILRTSEEAYVSTFLCSRVCEQLFAGAYCSVRDMRVELASSWGLEAEDFTEESIVGL